MGYSTGIQYGTAVINKVNKPLIANLNENTWKLIKLVISSFFNVCSESNRTDTVLYPRARSSPDASAYALNCPGGVRVGAHEGGQE